MAISKQQSMRPAEIELIDASNQHESTLHSHAQSLETLDENLSTETADREAADTALGTRIDNEVQTRTDADTALGTRINDEVQARTDADTALGTRIDNEIQARTDGDATLNTRINDEVQARTDADTALGTRIDNEVQARTDGDASLQGQIDALTDIMSCVATQSDIAFVAYTSPSKDNGMQLKYNISSGKYYVVAKYNGTWQSQKEI